MTEPFARVVADRLRAARLDHRCGCRNVRLGFGLFFFEDCDRLRLLFGFRLDFRFRTRLRPGVGNGAQLRALGNRLRPELGNGSGRCYRGNRARRGNRLRLFGAFRQDPAFDDDVARAADHDQVLDIVAAHQHQAAAGIDGGGVQHLQARLAVLAATHERRRCAAAHQPEDADQHEESKANAAGSIEETAAIVGHYAV